MVAIEVGDYNVPAATGNQDVPITTDLSAAPAGTWAVIFWLTPNRVNGGDVSGTWVAGIFGCVGFAANGGGSISTYACGWYGTDNTASSTTSRRTAAASITAPNSAGSGAQVEGSLVSFPDATHMRINWATVDNPHTYRFNYMIISGLSGAKVVNWSQASSTTGAKAVTGVGFQPDLVLHAHAAGIGGVPVSSAHVHLGLGAMNAAGEQWANSIYSQSGANPSNTSRWQRTDACLLAVDVTESQSMRAAFTSMDSDGFTVNFATMAAFGGAVNMISLCLDGVQSKLGSFTSSGDPQTVTHSAGFTARGALLTNDTNVPNTSPIAGAAWSLGAVAGASQRSAALFDRDSVSNTEADTLWSNTEALLAGTSGPAVFDAASVALTSTTTMTVDYSTENTGAEYLYCLLGDLPTHQLVNAG